MDSASDFGSGGWGFESPQGLRVTFLFLLRGVVAKKSMRSPGIEPGSITWQATIITTRPRTLRCVVHRVAGHWSSGMIPALGAGGREFDSRITPTIFLLCFRSQSQDSRT
jgi:hypothetical protein